jgi:hypothetical protein
LEDIDSQEEGVDAIYHLDDLVGYASWPNEVVATIRERSIRGIAGNYDSTTAADYPYCGCKAVSTRVEELSHLSYSSSRGFGSLLGRHRRRHRARTKRCEGRILVHYYAKGA